MGRGALEQWVKLKFETRVKRIVAGLEPVPTDMRQDRSANGTQTISSTFPPTPHNLGCYPLHCRHGSQFYSHYRLRGWQRSLIFPLRPFCLRPPISAQLLRRGPHCPTHIGCHSSGTVSSFMRRRGAGGCPSRIGSLGGTIAASTTGRT